MTGNEVLLYVQRQLPNDLPTRGFIEVINYVQAIIRGGRFWTFDFGVGSIDTVASYDTGTIQVVNGDATVTGTGTTFTSAMDGRKIRIGRIPYTVSSRTSNTELELTATYPGDSDTGLSFVIYQDEYALASDTVQLTELWDITNRRRLDAKPSTVLGDIDYRANSSGDALKYSLHGVNSGGDRLLRFAPYPTSQVRYQYFYEQDYTRVTTIGATIDIPSEQDMLVKQGCLARVAGRLGLDEKGRELTSFQQLLSDAWVKDQALMNIRVRLCRADNCHIEGLVYPSSQSIASTPP